MKKSERFYAAMLAVINSTEITGADKVEIIETLLSERDLATWSEKHAEKKRQDEEKQEVEE